MFYSRFWHTYWKKNPHNVPETYDNAIFCITGVGEFSAKSLRDNLDGCMEQVRSISPRGDIDELKKYIKRFLSNVENELGGMKWIF